MKAPVIYIPNFVSNSKIDVDFLSKNIPWEQRDTARAESFMSLGGGVSYTYGKPGFERTYVSVDAPDFILELMECVDKYLNIDLDVCFANKYDTHKNHVGWHKDDSNQIDQSKPIAIISIGAQREIWFKDNATNEVDKLLLENGSLAVMSAGMQDNFLHRIPKHSAICHTRISLTMRGSKL